MRQEANLGWQELKALSAYADTGYAADEVEWAVCGDDVTDAGTFRSNVRGVCEIRFRGTDAADEVIDWALLGVQKSGQPAEQIAYGTATLGVTEVGELFGSETTNQFYADTIAIDGQSWKSTVKSVNGVQYDLGTGAVTGGGIARLEFDLFEYKHVILKLSVDTAAKAAADITMFPSY